MHVNRRRFLELTAGAGAVSALQSCRGVADGPRRTSPGSKVTVEELDKAAEKPVLQLDGLSSPVVIQSIVLLEKDSE